MTQINNCCNQNDDDPGTTDASAAQDPAQREQCCQGVRCCIEPDFFKALCDPTRIDVLLCLAQGCDPRTVSDVASCCSVDLSVVSRHLKTLRDAGIADSEKQGKEVRYQIKYGEVVLMLRSLADAIEQCCPDGQCCPDDPPSGE